MKKDLPYIFLWLCCKVCSQGDGSLLGPGSLGFAYFWELGEKSVSCVQLSAHQLLNVLCYTNQNIIYNIIVGCLFYIQGHYGQLAIAKFPVD